jgi:hypothetical protein
MSHTLHRLGNKSALAGDWVVLAMSAQGINRRGSILRLRRFLRISLKHGPVNFGDMCMGNSFTKDPCELLSGIREDSLLNVVFDSEEAVRRFLEELGRARLGLSVVVSGLLERGCRCARKAGLVPHTFAMSLGVWGRTKKLPDKRTMEITTLCGHGLVSPRYVRLMAGKVAAGEMSDFEAASELARPCVCGAFNPVRAAELLGKTSRRSPKASRPRALHGDGGSSLSRSKRAAGARS